MCFGMGPMCWGYMHPWPGAAMPKEQEITMLEDQARMLENDLASIKKRLEELSK